MSGTPSSFVDGLTAAVRENPLAAALIGGGALWLLIGNDKLKNAASSLTAAAAPLADAGMRGQRAAAAKFRGRLQFRPGSHFTNAGRSLARIR